MAILHIISSERQLIAFRKTEFTDATHDLHTLLTSIPQEW